MLTPRGGWRSAPPLISTVGPRPSAHGRLATLADRPREPRGTTPKLSTSHMPSVSEFALNAQPPNEPQILLGVMSLPAG